MPEDTSLETSNINSLWLQNIYENLKNLESMERLAYEGCNSVLEYAQIPYEYRPIQIADIQYKNLKSIISEMRLLLTDLTPTIDSKIIEKYKGIIDKITPIINTKRLFINEIYSSEKARVINSKTTPFFDTTLAFLSGIRANIIKDIEHILYIKEEISDKPWKK